MSLDGSLLPRRTKLSCPFLSAVTVQAQMYFKKHHNLSLHDSQGPGEKETCQVLIVSC